MGNGTLEKIHYLETSGASSQVLEPQVLNCKRKMNKI